MLDFKDDIHPEKNYQFTSLKIDINYQFLSYKLKFFYFRLVKVKLIEITFDNYHYSFSLNVVKILIVSRAFFHITKKYSKKNAPVK